MRRRRLGQCNGYGGDRQAACPRYEVTPKKPGMSPPANRSFAASVLIEEDEALNMAS